MTTVLVPDGIMEKRPFLGLAEKRCFGPKSVFSPKKQPKFAKRLIFIWEKGIFLFAQLSLMWLEHGLSQEVDVFFGPKKSIFGQNFSRTRLQPLESRCILHHGIHLSDFSFPSYGHFRKQTQP